MNCKLYVTECAIKVDEMGVSTCQVLVQTVIYYVPYETILKYGFDLFFFMFF